MLAHPKPTPRGPKPPTRIRRSAPPARRTRVRQMKKGETAALRRECERLCSLITLTAHSLCECGCGRRSTEAAHILNKKAWPRVRYYLRNLMALAHPCHLRLRDANVSLTKPSPMRDLVLSLPGGRERWDAILWVSAGPRQDLAAVRDGLRACARMNGIAV